MTYDEKGRFAGRRTATPARSGRGVLRGFACDRLVLGYGGRSAAKFTADFDELCLFDRALTEAEIQKPADRFKLRGALVPA